MKVQDAIEVMSQRKRFHVIVFALLALNFMFIPIHIFVDLFLSYEPKHYCAYPQGGSKYQWIPYNHETHTFESCAIYEEPLTKAMEKAEKKRIEEEAYHKDVKVWDWKALKFKSKHYHEDSHSVSYHDDETDNGTETLQDDGYTGYETDDHRRRRREQPRKQGAGVEDRDAHRFVTEDGRILEPSEVLGVTEAGLGVTEASGDEAEVTTEVNDVSVEGVEPPVDVSEAPVDVSEAPVVPVVGNALESSDAPQEVTTVAPKKNAELRRPDSVTESGAEGHDAGVTSTPSKPSTDLKNADPEQDDHDDDDDDNHHHDDNVIVHRFSGSNGDRGVLLGAGTVGSFAPEHHGVDDDDDDDHDDVADASRKKKSGAKGDPKVTDNPMDSRSAGKPGHGVSTSGPGSHDHDSDAEYVGHAGDMRGAKTGGGKHAHDSASSDTHYVSDHGDASSKEGGKSGYGGHSKYLQKITPCEHGIHYLADVGTTLITEYGLSCSNDVSVITNTVLGTAMVAGAIIFAPFVDKYGRKTLFMMVCCQNCLISLGIAFVGDIRSYWVLRFLSRFYIEGVEIALLVLAVEMAPSKSRPIAPLILYVAYAIGQILLSLQAMLFRSWWKLQLAISVESILLIPFSWFLMPESIQWLVSMRRHTEAEKLIRLGCRLNGIILPSDFKLDKADGEDGDGSDDEGTGNGHAHGPHGPRKSAAERLRSTQLNLKNRPGTGEYLQHEFHAHIGEWRKILDLMKNHQLRRHFFIVSYMWAIVGFLYYGLTASTMVMKGNVYLNYCLSGLVMVPASVSIFILRRFGRKKPIFYFLIGAGIFIILSVTCPYKTPDGVDMYPVYLAIKLMAKYCVVSCLISIRLLIIELFPTPVRGTLIGLTALIGLLGSALGYYFLELITFSKWVGVAVGGLTILAAILSRMLPETSHRPLPDTINDMMAACREMFLNLLVAMPNMPRPEPQAPPPQPRPKRNMSALSAFSAVLSWRSRTKSGGGTGDSGGPVRSMSDEDFKRAPHPPLSSMTSSPLPRGDGTPGEVVERPAPALRSLVNRVRAAEQPHRPSLRERMSRALSQKRAAPERLEVTPRRARRTSSTPSLATAARRCGIDNPQYEQETPRVMFDLVRADSQGISCNGLEGDLLSPVRAAWPDGSAGGSTGGSPALSGKGGSPKGSPNATRRATGGSDTEPTRNIQATTHF